MKNTLAIGVIAAVLTLGAVSPAIADEVAPVDPPIAEVTPEVIADDVETMEEAPAAALTVAEPVTTTRAWLYTGGPDARSWPQTPYTGDPGCGTDLWIQTDTYRYGTPEEIAAVDALDDDGLLTLVNGSPEDSALYISHTDTPLPECEPVTPTECPAPTVLPTSTNLDTRGWVLHGDAEYVEGGILLTSDEWVDAFASLAVSFPLADARDFILSPTIADPAGSYGYAVIMVDENGARYHAEDVYSDELWSNEAVLPPTGGGQGGPYSGSLEDALAIGNPTIVSVELLFTSAGPNSALVSEGGVNCWIQPFDYAEAVDLPTPPVTPELAYTGASARAALLATGAAVLMLLLGVLGVAWRRRATL